MNGAEESNGGETGEGGQDKEEIDEQEEQGGSAKKKVKLENSHVSTEEAKEEEFNEAKK
jgi:hypothetical protein